MKKTTKNDAGAAAFDHYTQIPPSSEGEFRHAQAVVADLSKPTFADSKPSGLVVTENEKAV